jgi:CheY-like chemotaxis protein
MRGEDVEEMLATILELRGFRALKSTVTSVKRGEIDFVAFMQEHDPQVIVWDITPPYDKNWAFLQLLRSSETLKGRGIVHDAQASPGQNGRTGLWRDRNCWKTVRFGPHRVSRRKGRAEAIVGHLAVTRRPPGSIVGVRE